MIRLNLRSIELSSPGHIDFTGLGIAMGHLKDFLLGILDRFLERDFKKLELAKRQEKIEDLKIKNLKSLQELLENSGLNERQKREVFLQALLKQDFISDSVVEKRFLEVISIPDDTDLDL